MKSVTNTWSASRSQRPQDVNFHTAISYVGVLHMHPVQRGDLIGWTELLIDPLFAPDDVETSWTYSGPHHFSMSGIVVTTVDICLVWNSQKRV